MRLDSPELGQIRAISDKAQASWFSLLLVTAYVGLCVSSTQAADFFTLGRQTTLPVLNVQVSTRLFFQIGPMLVALVYAHFHLYQIRLWTALGRMPNHVDGVPLPHLIPPWHLTYAGLQIRPHRASFGHDLFREPAPTALARAGAGLALVSAWALVPVALLAAWWVALDSRNMVTIVLTSAAVSLAVVVGCMTFALMYRNLRSSGDPGGAESPLVVPFVIFVLGALLSIGGMDWSDKRMIALSRIGAARLPAAWVPERYAVAEFRDHWCDRERLDPCPELTGAAHAEWDVRRTLETQKIDRTIDAGVVRFANLDFSDGNLVAALFQNVDFSRARFARTLMERVEMRGSNLTGAILDGADLTEATLYKNNFRGSLLLRPRLDGASISRSDFSGALIVGSALDPTLFPPGPDETAENARNGFLFRLNDGDPQVGSKGGISQRFLPYDAEPDPNAAFVANDLTGAALRFLDADLIPREELSDALTEAFGDGSVLTGIESDRPCHWPGEILGDAEFFGRWHGFRQAIGIATWPPSDAIGKLRVVRNEYTPIDGDFDNGVFVRPRTVAVRNIDPIPLAVCSATVGRPCLETGDSDFVGIHDGIRRVCGKDR